MTGYTSFHLVKRGMIKAAVAAVVLLLVVGVAAPFLHADRYRERIQSSLSSALGRKVSIDGHVSFSLFSGPALAVDDVKIADADESREPFAYVDEIRAVPRLYSLWTGHLEFSSLILDGAHVNLVRSGPAEAPSWNFEPLLRPGLLAAFPTIHMRDSRINFVLDNRKSPFYLLEADLDVAPRVDDGSDWSVRFAGAPARSDRPAHGFGAIEAKGRWARTGGTNGLLELDLNLARSEMSDILTLLYGRDPGIRGIVSGQAHVAGPMQSLGIEGELRVSELHGLEQSAPAGAVFPFRVSGTLNTPAQHLEIFAEPKGGQPPLMMHLTAEGYLQRPFLKLELQSDGIPLGTVPVLLHNFGVNLPEGFQMTGMMNGAVSFDSRQGWTGSAVIPEVTLWLRGSTPLKFQQTAFAISGDQVLAGPVSVTSGQDKIAEASAAYSPGDGSFQVKLVSVDAPLATLAQRFPSAALPFPPGIRAGSWTGELEYSQAAGGAGRWRGEGNLVGASGTFPAFSQAIEIARAHVRIDGEDVQLDHMTLSTEKMEARGDYSYAHAAAVPHQFHLSVARADLPRLEALFQPVLNRVGSLIDRALGRSPVPKWLLDTKAEGTLQVEELGAVALDFSRLRTRVSWDGARVDFTEMALRAGRASISGAFRVDMKGAAPVYKGAFAWANLPWKGGLLGGAVKQFETSGTGLETLTHLKTSGELTGKDLELAPLGRIEKLTGTFAGSWSGTTLQWKLPELRIIGADGEVWSGAGSAQGSEGEVTLRVVGGRPITLAGSLMDGAKNWVER